MHQHADKLTALALCKLLALRSSNLLKPRLNYCVRVRAYQRIAERFRYASLKTGLKWDTGKESERGAPPTEHRAEYRQGKMPERRNT